MGRCWWLAACNSTGPLASAELYDPATGMWTATGSMATARSNHTATLLPNGQVLVAGGMTTLVSLSKRGTIRSGDWDVDGDRQHGHCTRLHTATLLPNGQVLVAGGSRQHWRFSKRGTIRSGDWDVDGDRQHGHCTLLSHGDVAAEWAGAGGRRLSELRRRRLASAELYDPATGVWTATGSMATARDSHTATLLPNGQVLVAGGRATLAPSSKRRTIRSGDREVDDDRQLAPARALTTRRRCCRTGRCLSQEETPAAGSLRARNSTDRRQKWSTFNSAHQFSDSSQFDRSYESLQQQN